MNDKEELEELKQWINDNLIKCKTANPRANSYYLKHLFEYETDIYVTEETFIKVMDELGYEYKQVGVRGHDTRDYKVRKPKDADYYIAKGLMRKAKERGDIS